VDIQWNDEVSSLWNFTGFDTGAGDTISVDTPYPTVQTNSGVAILNPTGIASAATALADLTGRLHRTVHHQMMRPSRKNGGRHRTQLPIQVASTAAMIPVNPESSSWDLWVQGFGGRSQRDDERDTLGYDLLSWGVIGGGTLSPSSNVQLGLFGGIAGSETTVEKNAHTLYNLTGFVEMFSQIGIEHWFLQSSLAGGITNTDSKRLVLSNHAIGGSQRARAEHESGFISTRITGGGHVPEIGHGFSLRPSISVGYATEWIPDYQESGSSADLMVDDRIVQIINGRVERPRYSHSTMTPFAMRSEVAGLVEHKSETRMLP